MTVTVIDPAAGTSNPRTWDRKVVALITSSQSDPRGQWDCISIDSTAGDVVFTLPGAAGFTGKEYTIVWLAGSAHAVTIAAAAGDTIGGHGATSYSFVVLGDSVSLISSGQTDWIIGGIAGARSAATDTILGDVNIAGTPADPTGPQVPVLEDVTFTINSLYVPVATAVLTGAVEISGTPISAAAPIVPVVESGGVLGTTASPVVVPLAKITGLGADGSITFINGLAVARTNPT